MGESKDFDRWNQLKQRLNAIGKPPFFNEREIWWCSVGVNIGYDVYGKGRLFTRPVLVLKKQSINSFIGVPMSTKLKERSDYYQITIKDKQTALMLGEIRKFDSRRLADKMGKVSEEKFEEVKAVVRQIFSPVHS